MCVLCAGVYVVGVEVAVETGDAGLLALRAAEEEGREVEIGTGIEAEIETEEEEETRKGRTGEGLEGEEDQDLQGWCVSIRICMDVK